MQYENSSKSKPVANSTSDSEIEDKSAANISEYKKNSFQPIEEKNLSSLRPRKMDFAQASRMFLNTEINFKNLINEESLTKISKITALPNEQILEQLKLAKEKYLLLVNAGVSLNNPPDDASQIKISEITGLSKEEILEQFKFAKEKYQDSLLPSDILKKEKNNEIFEFKNIIKDSIDNLNTYIKDFSNYKENIFKQIPDDTKDTKGELFSTITSGSLTIGLLKKEGQRKFSKTPDRSLFYDVAGRPITSHLPLMSNTNKQNKAAHTIQTFWRQSHRARVIHRNPNLFDKNSKNMLANQFTPADLPTQFRHLANYEIPPLIVTAKHGSSRLEGILQGGVIYPKFVAQDKLQGISTNYDAARMDSRLAFLTPFSSYTVNEITLNVHNLFKLNDARSIYFKFYDWAKWNDLEIDLSNDIKLRFEKSFPRTFCHFIDKSNNETIAPVDISEEVIFHGLNNGLEGLNQYLSFFIFKIIKALPPENNDLSEKIYQSFSKLDREKKLITHLQKCMRILLSDCELDCINKINLNFSSIEKIIYGNHEYDFNELRNKIASNDIQYFIDLFNNHTSNILFKKSFFLASGMLGYAIKHNAIEVADLIRNEFKDILAAPEQVKQDVEDKKRLPILDSSEFIKVGEALSGATFDKGIYQNIYSRDNYYVKYYSNDEQARSEVLAARLYELAGLLVPETHLIAKGNKLGVASKSENISPISGKDSNFAKELAGCYDGFLIDAWLANWDVVGLQKDNLNYLTLDQAQLAMRIDFGGALHFRAQGSTKDEFFTLSGEVEELKNLLNPDINPSTAEIFKHITEEDLKIGAAKLKRITPDKISELVFSCYPDDKYLTFREALHKTLCARRETLLSKYELKLTDSIEIIAKDILSQYFQKSDLKNKHGAMHACRVAMYIPIMAELYRQRGYEISQEDVKLMMIAALFHDTGRQNDNGNDNPEWEREGERLCYEYLINLGVSHHKASQIADSIVNKDSSLDKRKKIYRKLLKNADCLDVLRSTSWIFDYKYMDYYKEFEKTFSSDRAQEIKFLRFIDQSVQFVANTKDLHQAFTSVVDPTKTFAATADHDQKMHYECDRECYRHIRDQMRSLPLLNSYYEMGIMRETEEEDYRTILSCR